MSGSSLSAPASAEAADPPGDASPLAMTVHSLPVETLDVRRRTRYGRLKMLLLLAVCATPVIASYLSYYVIRPGARSNYSELISPPRPMPTALSLTDAAGRPFAPASLRGQWLLVVVSATACDARCENRLLLQRQLREMLGREKDRLDKLWLVVGDGPLGRAAVDAVQGSDGTVLRLPRHELATWLEAEPGRELEDHLYLVDPHGQWMMRTPTDPQPARLKRDLDRLLRASASWDRPGR